MTIRSMTAQESINAVQSDPQLAAYALTPEGRRAGSTTDRLIRESVTRHSNFNAAAAETFTQELNQRLVDVADVTTRFNEVHKRLLSDLTPDEFDALQAEFFALEAKVKGHVWWVIEREQRIEAIGEQLADPVAALSALQEKYPSTKKFYMAPFGR